MIENAQEILQQAVNGRETLSKQELMNAITCALESKRVMVKMVPGDVKMLYDQMIEEKAK